MVPQSYQGGRDGGKYVLPRPNLHPRPPLLPPRLPHLTPASPFSLILLFLLALLLMLMIRGMEFKVATLICAATGEVLYSVTQTTTIGMAGAGTAWSGTRAGSGSGMIAAGAGVVKGLLQE
ncbi:uncharacterized protein STEHIDRAFT_163216 [Stereum hirsutum FP-91666 SS1]|uniref:Uncharacterized protein n=1 Tax=Stereum hirsutum (strain FP-91666) TaxID=721885 RepID=R7S062_STEHR|nr:uncharacterized protein STEHIDRAFT_163216 [Stereum hirsutum FP-91666 SS1]EIM79962.1 hypothetical protein STEHIDRAFT_163216 [Stereum hirsutum FP-91666 SS1]